MARQELREEAGVDAGVLTLMGRFNPFNGVTNELCNAFLARGLHPAEEEPDDTEEFEILHLREDEVHARIADGSLWDGMSLAAWMLYKAKHP